MAAVEQLTFGNEPVAVRAAAGPSGPGYEIERELAAAIELVEPSRACTRCISATCSAARSSRWRM